MNESEALARERAVARAKSTRRTATNRLVRFLQEQPATPERVAFIAEHSLPLESRASGARKLQRLLRELDGIALGGPLAFAAGYAYYSWWPHAPGTKCDVVITDSHLVLYRSARNFTTRTLQGARPRLTIGGTDQRAELEVLVHTPGGVKTEGREQASITLRLGLSPAPWVLAAVEVASGRRVVPTASRPGAALAPPAPRLIRSATDAELVAADWVTYLGFGVAQVTPRGADGGIDVESPRAVAQVKMEALPTGRSIIQQLHGAATVEKKAGLCFSLAGFTDQAHRWADRAGVPLFRFDLQGVPAPVNAAAHTLVASIERAT